jgi:hypothetical protein
LDQLLLFPAVKRVGTIRRWASTVSGYNPKSREKTLRHYLDQYAAGLRKRDFPDDVVTQDVASLEIAVRVEISRLLQYDPTGRSA